MFSPTQIEQLAAKLDAARVSRRKGPNGATLSYLETWDVIATANAVFGFDGWSRETVMLEQLHPPVLITDPASAENGGCVCAYSCKARVTVFAGDRAIVREGCGAARGFARTASEAIEQAIKAAESDATKRAFATFGNAFGLCLYDKQQRDVAPLANGRRQSVEQAIDTGFVQRRPPTSQRAVAARNGKLADDIPV
jgi:DNA recombination protein Rad52